MEAALETAGLTYVFPDGNGIKNITFQVKRGEIYALYGGHNAGKSVLLQAIIGTLRPQSGTLKLFGNIDYQQERRRIGFVPQKPVTIGSLSPADMLHYFSSAFGSTESRFLDILHLNLKEKKAVRRLPLSTQRLVNLAVALLGNPDMIILDDPFSGLDKGECEHLLSVLTYLHEMNHTTLLISGQDYTLLSRLASKYGVMADGKLLCELTTGELKESCQRCIKIRTPQLERVITILSQRFPDFEVLGHDLIRIFHCNEQSGEINTLLVRSGIEVSEIWLAGMEPTDYLLKMTGGAKSDPDDAK
ncbi:ATP-binding cassette domain-containing protein [Anaerotignum lactatifermentans]|uniref:ATP-binding cassette domain-containing protein n=1 Tax=Anaerotignum lactatifermentans TaxID=160404 RepID=UPI001FA8F31C|nr:ABC transporter ATP-binding protein [Anaerotignum lactatifermentans]